MLARPRPAARPSAWLGACAAALALCLPAAPAQAAAGPVGAAGGARVLIAFLPEPTVVPPPVPVAEPPPEPEPVLDRLAAQRALSIGLSSATQGTYDPTQALLDITQGTRASLSAYKPKRPLPLVFVPAGRGALFGGWLDVVARANGAPAEVEPGLLAGSVPGGAGYAGVRGRSQQEAIAAANRAGRVSLVSLGPPNTVARRAQALLHLRRLVVAGLPTGDEGDRAVAELVRARGPGELLLVMQTPPLTTGPQLLAIGALGLGGPGQLTSETTHLDGIVAGIDVLPTTLDWLGLAVPSVVKGQPMRVVPGRDAAALTTLEQRLHVLLSRRLPALWTVLGAWLFVLLCAMLIADRRGLRWAMRIGALAVLWIPAVLLVTALLRPARGLELALIAVLTLVLGALTDRLVAWPRGPAVPAFAAVAAYAVDLAFGSPLIIRSLLGPNPLYGSRFYGVGNELEAALSSLLLIGVGALLMGRGRSRAAVVAFALGGVVLGLVMGAGRLGADVGGIITIGAGAATAAVLMLPGGVTKRALAAVIIAPVVGLAVLAALDAATGGDSHFTRTVLHANGSGALWDTVIRRYGLAFRALRRGFMPVATLLALLTVALGARRQARLLAPVGGDPAYRAALWGLAAVGIAGALFNDSGPVLLLVAVFLGLGVAVYLRGDPRLAGPGTDAPAR